MQAVIFYALITFFSIYGIFAFILFITDFFFDNKYLKEKTIYTIFCVKNEICKIENIVKTIIFKAYKNDVGLLDQRIIIIDLGSNDGTYELLKKLEKSEKTILVYKIEEIPKLLENL
jgi:hypothetical protein